MFTGIIEETGTLSQINKSGALWKIRISAMKVLEDTRIGDSIAVDGVCLTVTAAGDSWFSVDVSAETRERSTLMEAEPGRRVNLERAATLSGRLGGHLVLGHVDATGTIAGIKTDGDSAVLAFSIPAVYMKYIVDKGCIAVDGASLTAVEPHADSFSVWVIPHTLEGTTLAGKKPGDRVNIECDIIAKYTENLLDTGGRDSRGHGSAGAKGKNPDAGLSEYVLREKGF